jgi:hypothetical protein
MIVFVTDGAAVTTPGRWIGLQPLGGYVRFAVRADPIPARGDPHQRSIDFPDLPDMLVDLRQLQIHEKIGYRCLAKVVNLAGELDIGLIVRTDQLLPYFLAKLEVTVIQLFFEFTDLIFSQHHGLPAKDALSYAQDKTCWQATE